LIDTSGSMEDTQLARAVSELGGLTRQLGYGADVVIACCDAAVHQVRKAFTSTDIELYGGGGTDLGVGLRAFIERKLPSIDLLVIVSDCRTPWPKEVPPFPVAPRPITDDFLKLLDDSFGRDWRSPRTWPWARIGWAYGFTLVGAAMTIGIAIFV